MMQRERSNSSACIPDSQDTVSVDATPEKKETCQDQAQGTNLQEVLYLSRILKNEGTVARDHLANERTFLSWLTMGLCFMAVAIATAQLYRIDVRTSSVILDKKEYAVSNDATLSIFSHIGQPFCSICMSLSILSILFGLFRYFSVQALLLQNKFPATRIIILLLLIPTIALWCLLFVLNIKLTSS